MYSANNPNEEILRLRAENEKLREQNNRIAKMYEALEWDYKVALSNKETNTK